MHWLLRNFLIQSTNFFGLNSIFLLWFIDITLLQVCARPEGILKDCFPLAKGDDILRNILSIFDIIFFSLQSAVWCKDPEKIFSTFSQVKNIDIKGNLSSVSISWVIIITIINLFYLIKLFNIKKKHQYKLELYISQATNTYSLL